MFDQIRGKVESLGDPSMWMWGLLRLQWLVTVGMLALYCSILHLIHADKDNAHLHQAIVLHHLSTGNLTKDKEVTQEGVMLAVEEFLNSTYRKDVALSWRGVLETPALRQIMVKETPCFIGNAPKESCDPILVRRHDVNTTCSRCWTTYTENTHICPVAEPGKDGDDGTCDQGCEHGFGYCAQLGDTVLEKGYFFPEGGHGLQLTLDANQSYVHVLRRLRSLQWLASTSRYVSLSLTTLTDEDTLARVRLHFLRFVVGQWIFTFDLSLGRYPNYFPTLYNDKSRTNTTARCDNILKYFVRGPRDAAFRAKMQYLMLLPLLLLVTLTAVETPYFWWLFTKVHASTWQDQAVLVINVVGLVLHAGVVAVLFLTRVEVIKIICKPERNHGKFMWMNGLVTALLLCLVLLWLAKIFCIRSSFFEPLTQCFRLARGGVAAMLMVPFFLLPLLVFGVGVVVCSFADDSSKNLRQAVVTVSWAVLGQARLEEAWPVLAVVRGVALFMLLPLAVAMAGATMSYTLVSSAEADKQNGDTDEHIVIEPL